MYFCRRFIVTNTKITKTVTKQQERNMKRIAFILAALLTMCLTVGAQSADKLYEEGKKFYDAQNYTAAFPKLKAAAEKGHKKAQYRLGRCYEKGRGTEENDKTAAEWYGKSAAQGYAKAQYQLGKCYKDGDGVAKDKKKAFDLFKKAASQEYADAEFALGKAYLKGKGTTADKAQAKKWISRAVGNEKGGKEILAELRKDAADGDEDAKEILALIGKK
jgi:TPR repeat protein